MANAVYEYAKINGLLLHSAVKEKEFREFFENIRINTAVEIGTYKGVSTAYIAKFANRVFTFDIADYPEKYKVWKDLGVENKIYFYVIKGKDANFQGKFKPNENRVDIKNILDTIEFDFAFIDGEHNYEAVKKDFEMVKKCGRVLLHDANHPLLGKQEGYKGINKFANEIGAEFIGNMAYWRGNMKVRAKISFLDSGRMRRRGDVFEIDGSKLNTFLKYNLVEIIEKEYNTKVVEPLTAKITYDTKNEEITTPTEEVISKPKKRTKNAKRQRKPNIN